MNKIKTLIEQLRVVFKQFCDNNKDLDASIIDVDCENPNEDSFIGLAINHEYLGSNITIECKISSMGYNKSGSLWYLLDFSGYTINPGCTMVMSIESAKIDTIDSTIHSFKDQFFNYFNYVKTNQK